MRWPLTTVLDLAAREEAGARVRLAAALVREAERMGERADAAAALAAARAAEGTAAARVRDGMRAGDLACAARHLVRAAAAVERRSRALRSALAAEADAAREVHSRRDALSAARSHVEALERHRERWRMAQARRRGRAEDAAADDLVSAQPRAGR